MSRKLCRPCSLLKPRTRFLRHNYGSAYQKRFSADDVLAKVCPVCQKPFTTTHKAKVYCSKECAKKKHRKDYRKDYNKQYKEDHPEKHHAQKVLGKAIWSGELRRLPFCEVCLKNCRTHAHHTDYSKPLFVYWLCPSCHVKVHKSQSPIAILPAPNDDCLFISL